MSNAHKTGKCLCGAVQYEVALSETGVHVCHCNICRVWGGGPALAVSADQKDIKISGEDQLNWYSSSEWAERGFCKTCGTHVCFRSKEGKGNYFGISAGTLDDYSDLKLDSQIFIDKKPTYYDFKNDTPCLTEEEFLKMYAAG